MDGVTKQGSWIQCQECGHIHYVEDNVPIEKMYTTSICPRCGEKKGLNCGRDKNDIYYFYNPSLDERFYY